MDTTKASDTRGDAVASRLCGDYLLSLPRADERLTACDAIALAELARGRIDWLFEYYSAAFRSVARGLRLRNADALLALCTAKGMGPSEQHAHLGSSEFIAAHRLLETRRAAIGLLRSGEGILLGHDPLAGDPRATDPLPYQPVLRRVYDWWTAERERMKSGVLLADEALCAVLQWDVVPGIRFERLLIEFGYPEPAPVQEQWLDSF